MFVENKTKTKLLRRMGEAIREDHWLGSRKAHNVGSSPPENCCGTEEEVGEGESAAEEGCLIPKSHIERNSSLATKNLAKLSQRGQLARSSSRCSWG